MEHAVVQGLLFVLECRFDVSYVPISGGERAARVTGKYHRLANSVVLDIHRSLMGS